MNPWWLASYVALWAVVLLLGFLVAVQEHYSLSRLYEVFATPFAFLIDERGVIASKGIINNRQHIGYILGGAHAESDGHADREPAGAKEGESQGAHPSSVLT